MPCSVTGDVVVLSPPVETPLLEIEAQAIIGEDGQYILTEDGQPILEEPGS